MAGQRSITLVACCGPKLSSAAPAADLYVSSLFKKARIYAERRGRWFILSALHGLVDPTEVIAPYDVTLKKMPAAKRREWGRKVRVQMENAGLIGLPLVALAGKDYVQPLTDAGLVVGQPMKGKSIGKQLQWLNEENGIRSSPGNASAPTGSFPSTIRSECTPVATGQSRKPGTGGSGPPCPRSSELRCW